MYSYECVVFYVALDRISEIGFRYAWRSSSACVNTTSSIIQSCTNFEILVLVAGLPLDQKVVQYGPFVLNTQEQVYQALMDYQNHKNGFERAFGWESKIGKSMVG